MKYMGSKRRLAKYIVPIMTRNRTPDQYFVEPFCGGCNLTEYVYGKRIASDINEYIIYMFKALQDGWIPPENISEEEYKDIKENKNDYPMELVCFVGFCCSFGGKWFGGYARDKNKNNYADIGRSNLVSQSKYLHDVEYIALPYHSLNIPPRAIIYCDPPYFGTTGYRDKFDHDRFHQWCLDKSKKHDIYISEYSMPKEFVSIYSREQTCNIDSKNMKSDIKKEHLFIVRGSNLDNVREKQNSLFGED